MQTEDRIREALRRRAEASPFPDGLWERIEQRTTATGTGLGQRVGVALVALTLAGVSLVFLAQAFRSTPPPKQGDRLSIPAGVLVYSSLVDPDFGDVSLYMINLPRGDPSILLDREAVSNFELSPDGKTLAYVRPIGPYVGELWTLNLSTGHSQRIVRDVGTIFTPSWHPDGKHIAFAAESYVTDPATPVFAIYSVTDDAQDMRILAEPREGVIGLDWSPDGHRIAYLENAQANIRVLDLRSGEKVTVWDHRDGDASTPSWSPDGQQIAIEVDGVIVLVSRDAPFGSTPLTPSTTEAIHPTWSPTGDALFFAGRAAEGDDLDIFVFNLTTGATAIVAATEQDDFSPSFASA